MTKSHLNSNKIETPKFKLPSFGGGGIKSEDDPSLRTTNNFSSLSDFASFHLKTNTPTFALPKLSSSPILVGSGGSPLSIQSGGLPSLTPHQESLQKIMNLRKMTLSESEEKNSLPNETESDLPLKIDLTSALSTDTRLPNPNRKPINVIPDDMHDIFIPQFIECDIVPLLEQQITHDCEIDISSLLDEILVGKTVNSSKFGKILCKKYRLRELQYIKHSFDVKSRINSFNFGTPSPDDVTLAFLAKARTKRN